MTFSELAGYLGKLEGTSSRLEMTRILAELLGKTSPEEARLVAYMSQGRLGPAYKSPDMGVADKQMIKALGPGAEKVFKKTGDLGKTIEQIKSPHFANGYVGGKQNIKEVYKRLLEIAEAVGEGSQEKKQGLIRELVGSLDPVGAKYAVKMILGKLRTGFSDMTILDALSWMIAGDKSLRTEIEPMYNVRADLGEVAKLIKETEDIKRLRIEPEIGTPVLMARAERASSAGEIWERNGKCALEYKLDGLRIQAHIRNKEITLYSRGLENVTSMYPDVVEGLKDQTRRECIVEGEMIALDREGKFLPFQETAQRKRKYDIDEMIYKVPLTIYLFDVLYVDGKSVMHQGNEKRRDELLRLVGRGSVVRVMPRIIASDETDIDVFFESAIKEGTEGIIAKKLDGPYQAGARDFNWIKYKKSYDKSALTDTIDAVIMGYDVGQGKRAGFGIGGFLIGVYRPNTEMFLTVAKVGTGLTDGEWRTLLGKLKPQASSLKPHNYEVSKAMECDFWVEPRMVVEVRADEITRSPMHTSGYALRFPRFVGWREKKPEEATSEAEIERLYKLQKK